MIAGAVFALTGLGVGAVGGGLFATFGSDGTLNSGSHSLSTSSSALVSDVADIDDTEDVADVVGDPKLRLSVNATGPTKGLFIGIGPAQQVERYLAGTRYAEVTDLDVDPFKLERRTHRGTQRPGRPAAQDFWVAKATGSTAATLRWKVTDGDYRLVLMNADGSPRVHADGDVGLTIPHVRTIAWSLVGGGLLLVVAGGAGIALAARRPREG